MVCLINKSSNIFDGRDWLLWKTLILINYYYPNYNIKQVSLFSVLFEQIDYLFKKSTSLNYFLKDWLLCATFNHVRAEISC